MGILEYLSQTNDNTDFIPEEDRFKFIDDLSVLEIINLISIGLSSYNYKLHVPSDISVDHNQYLPTQNFNSQESLRKISDWTDNHLMKLNPAKSKYMIVNFTDNYQFNTRLSLDQNVLQQVKETRLLGVVFRDDLTWKSNTELIVKQAYKRMILLHRLYEFGLPTEEMVNIHTLYIRSILESSAVVWHSAITQAEETDIERVQKVALKVILKSDYESYENALHNPISHRL